MENKENLPAGAATTPVKAFNLEEVTQKDIPSIVDSLKSQLKQFSSSEDDRVPHISCVIPGYGQVDKIEDVPTLVKILCGIEMKAEIYTKRIESLGLTEKAFIFNEQGHSLKKWQDFLLYRINQVRHKKKIESLKNSITKLEAMMSEKDRLQNELKKVLTGVEDDLL